MQETGIYTKIVIEIMIDISLKNLHSITKKEPNIAQIDDKDQLEMTKDFIFGQLQGAR